MEESTKWRIDTLTSIGICPNVIKDILNVVKTAWDYYTLETRFITFLELHCNENDFKTVAKKLNENCKQELKIAVENLNDLDCIHWLFQRLLIHLADPVSLDKNEGICKKVSTKYFFNMDNAFEELGIEPLKDENIVLYHGTSATFADNIFSYGCNPLKSAVNDFGRAYYLTDDFKYSIQRGRYKFRNNLAVLIYVIKKKDFFALKHFSFETSKLWKDFVLFCREGRPMRTSKYHSYKWISGPEYLESSRIQYAIRKGSACDLIDKSLKGIIFSCD